MGQDREGQDTSDPSGAGSAEVPSDGEDSLLRAVAEIPDPSLEEVRHLAAAPRDKLDQGTVVAGRYRLDRLLGGGGMGVVWQATHLVTRRQVALKFIVRHALHRAEFRRRFLREARAASAVRHPNVVEVLDVFELEDQSPVMVMELLSGETLRSVICREGKLSVESAAGILLPVSMAVGAAHAAGVIHRDLKPENIFLVDGLARPEAVKVLDFGVAKVDTPDFPSEAESLTSTGSAPGTPCYMAPEQATGDKDVDARADIWALGVVLYECLAGARPLDASGVGEAVLKLMTEGIKPLDRVVSGLPADITALVASMLSQERAHRPQSLREVSDVLGRYVSGGVSGVGFVMPPRRSGAGVARRAVLRPAAFAAAGACVAGVVGWSLLVPSRSPSGPQGPGMQGSGEQLPPAAMLSALAVQAAAVPAAELALASSRAESAAGLAPSAMATPATRQPPPRLQPRSTPSASALPPVASVPANGPPPKADCDPPYEFDGQGRKLWKRQCL
jgi:serine/threonine-protein kinase